MSQERNRQHILKKSWHKLRENKTKIALLVIFFFMMVFGWVIQLGISLEKTMLSQEYYEKILDSADVEGLRNQLLKEVTRDLDDHLLWDESLIQKAFMATADKRWIREEAKNMVKKTLLALQGEKDQLHLTLDLEEQEEIFKGELKDKTLANSPEELEVIDAGEEDLDKFIEETFSFPEKVTLFSSTEEEKKREHLEKAQSWISALRLFIYTAPYLVIVLLAAMTAWITGYKGMLNLLGGSMAASGLTFMLSWQTARAWLDNNIFSLLKENSFQVVRMIWPYLDEGWLLSLTGDILNQVSLIFAGAGMLLLLVARLRVPRS